MMAGEFLAEGHNGDVYVVDEGVSLLEQLEWVSWSTSQSAVQLRFFGGQAVGQADKPDDDRNSSGERRAMIFSLVPRNFAWQPGGSGAAVGWGAC